MAQFSLHNKSCSLLNINHYYDPLITLFNHMSNEQFLHEKYCNMALIDSEQKGYLINSIHKLPSVKTYITEKQV